MVVRKTKMEKNAYLHLISTAERLLINYDHFSVSHKNLLHVDKLVCVFV